jgi:hypothetical protein
MANKDFYSKKLNKGTELCLVVGYVERGMACVFERNADTKEQIPHTSYVLPVQKAVELYLLKN